MGCPCNWLYESKSLWHTLQAAGLRDSGAIPSRQQERDKFRCLTSLILQQLVPTVIADVEDLLDAIAALGGQTDLLLVQAACDTNDLLFKQVEISDLKIVVGKQ